MSNFKFDLGDKVKDAITNFSGIVVARSQYLTGCNRYGVQGQTLTKDGVPGEWQNFDENVITLVTKLKVTLKTQYTKGKKKPDVGGPPNQEVLRQ